MSSQQFVVLLVSNSLTLASGQLICGIFTHAQNVAFSQPRGNSRVVFGHGTSDNHLAYELEKTHLQRAHRPRTLLIHIPGIPGTVQGGTGAVIRRIYQEGEGSPKGYPENGQGMRQLRNPLARY